MIVILVVLVLLSVCLCFFLISFASSWFSSSIARAFALTVVFDVFSVCCVMCIMCILIKKLCCGCYVVCL